jgi:hypothetical protein
MMTVMEDHSRLDEMMKPLRAASLFYPCSGQDTLKPIETFLPWLNQFWFVDDNYTGRPLLARFPQYRLLEVQSELVSGITICRRLPFEIKVYHQTYERTEDRRPFLVHQCCGRGYNAFRALFKLPGKAVSVFFYRGDSGGEGGSGFNWLWKERLKNVLEVLEDGGLIVSDGSNAMPKLRRARRADPGDSEQAAIQRARPFTFAGRRFERVGHLEQRYGPTLIWRAKRL